MKRTKNPEKKIVNILLLLILTPRMCVCVCAHAIHAIALRWVYEILHACVHCAQVELAKMAELSPYERNILVDFGFCIPFYLQ